MALFRRFFYRKPPDRLLEISERVYVFDCCFSTDVLQEDEYKVYLGGIVAQLQDHYPDASFMVFNFREGERRSYISDILSQYDMTVMEYPRQYEGCPLLQLEMIHHFLRSSESWLSLEGQQNVLLMHCERGGWPVLAFMLAGLLLYRKQYSGEQKTLEMIYKQAPKQLLHLLSPINSQTSQLRYLQYISRRNLGSDWPPLDTPLLLDCLILRVLPLFEDGKGCRPSIRVFGQDPSTPANRGSKLLFSMRKTRKLIPLYSQEECMLVKINVHCRVQGDIVLECFHLDKDLIHEEMMFRVMFNTAFVRGNVLVFNRDEIDIMWDAKDQFPRDFRAEVLFLDADAVVPNLTTDVASEDGNEAESASPEEFFEVEEIFSNAMDGQEGKGESDTSIAHNNLTEDLDNKEVWKEDIDPHTYQDCASDDGNQKQDKKIDSNIDTVKDITVDDVKYRLDSKLESNCNIVKDIAVDDGDTKSNCMLTAADNLINPEAKEVIEDVSGKLESMEDEIGGEEIAPRKKVESKVSQQKSSADINRQKSEKLQFAAPRKQLLTSTKPTVDTVAGKQKTKQQEPNSGKIAKPVSKWIPTNKGSYMNSMHVSYPPNSVHATHPKNSMPTSPVSAKESSTNVKLKMPSIAASVGNTVPKDATNEIKTRKVDLVEPLQSLLELSASSPTLPVQPVLDTDDAGLFPAEADVSPPDIVSIPSSLPPPPPLLAPLQFHAITHVSNSSMIDMLSPRSSSPASSSLNAPPPPPPPPPLPLYFQSSSISLKARSSLPPPPLPLLSRHNSETMLTPPSPLSPLDNNTLFVPTTTTSSSPRPPPPPPPPPPLSTSSQTSSKYVEHDRVGVHIPPPPPLPPFGMNRAQFLTLMQKAPPLPPIKISRVAPPPPPPPPPPSFGGSPLLCKVPPPPPPPPPVYGTPKPQTTSIYGPSLPPPPPPPPPLMGHAPPPPPPPPPPLMGHAPSPPPPPPPPLMGHAPSPPPPPPPFMGGRLPPPPPSPSPLMGGRPPPPTPPHAMCGTSTPPPPPPPPFASRGAPPPPPLPMHKAPPPPPPPMHRAPPPPPPPMHKAPPPPPPPMHRAPPPPPPPIHGAPPPLSRNGAPPPPPPPSGGPRGPPPPPPSGGHGAPPPPPPLGAKGAAADSRGLSMGRGRGFSRLGMGPSTTTPRRSSLKPLHWSKVTRALQGSLWEELQRYGEPQIAPEFDLSEIERLFSATVPKAADSGGKSGARRNSTGSKSDKVNLIDLRRANNTEIMLTKVKMPLSDMMAAVLAMDESVLDVDQVENLIKFCPTKEEMELLKAYTGDKNSLGKCEQYFMELMKVPRVESKLRVFSFKIQFGSQISEFKKSLNTVNSACDEVRNSAKLKEIMKRILFLGNTLNQGTARGSAVGFKLDSLLKLSDTRASNSKMTLMHYLCKGLASKSTGLLDFHLDLISLEPVSKVQLKSLAEEMQAIIKGLEKVKQELTASETDGPVSETFRKTLKEFIAVAETEVASVTNLYTVVGRNADALALYFGEDPARYPFEQVTSTLLNFTRLFRKAHEENCKQDEMDRKKAEKEAEMTNAKGNNLTKKQLFR